MPLNGRSWQPQLFSRVYLRKSQDFEFLNPRARGGSANASWVRAIHGLC